MSPTESDVIVIGGGPAGSATAITCAKAGLRVLVLERAPFPRHAAGETLHPGVEPLLRQLGVWDDVSSRGWLRHCGIRVSWGGLPRYEPYGETDGVPWEGFQAPRADLDAILLDRARAAGATILQPAMPSSVLRGQDGRVVGVTANGAALRATFVIDASGRRQWLASQLRLVSTRHSPRLVARYGYVRGSCEAAQDVPLFDGDGNGWMWIARVQPDLFQWTRLSLTGDFRAIDGPPPLLDGCRPAGRTRAADVTWRTTPSAGPGWFLCGDAAAVVDPASSHGVLKALLGGILAGATVCRIRTGAIGEEAARTAYVGWVRSSFSHDVRVLRALYARRTGNQESRPSS